MSNLSNIKNIYNINSYDKIAERLQVFEIEFKCNPASLPTVEIISETFAQFSSNDSIKLSITDQADNTYFALYKDQQIAYGNDDILSSFEESDSLTIKIYVEKCIINNSLSVYDFNSFSDYITQMNTCDILETFNNLLCDRNFIIFNVFEDNITLSTKNIFFKSVNQNSFVPDENRLELLSRCKETTTFFSISNISLHPDDFFFSNNYENNPFSNIFNNIRCLLSLIYIADSAHLNKDSVLLSFSGQRNLEFNYNINSTHFHNEELYKIFNWIYIDGNSIDKAAIARNIISLHCKFTNLVDIDQKTLSSIKSNFNLYQKSNVDRYINLKNDIADYIIELTDKTYELASSIPNSIKNNMLAVFTFLLTVVLANIVSDSPLDNILTRDITAIFEMILLGSIVYLIFSVIDVNYKIRNMTNGYALLRENYQDVFDPIEIDIIFNINNKVEKAVKEIKHMRKVAIITWIIIIVLGLVIIEAFSQNPIIYTYILNLIKAIFKLNI